jgi:hypothetical protein
VSQKKRILKKLVSTYTLAVYSFQPHKKLRVTSRHSYNQIRDFFIRELEVADKTNLFLFNFLFIKKEKKKKALPLLQDQQR